MKTLFRLAVGAIVAIGLAASAGIAAAQDKGKIYYLVPTLLDEFQTGSIDAITKFMKDVGYEVVSLDGQNQSTTQLNQIDDVINLKPTPSSSPPSISTRPRADREDARGRHPRHDLRPADHLDTVRLHVRRRHGRNRPHRG